jgi:hypothetical protein
MFSEADNDEQELLRATMESLGMPYEEIVPKWRFTSANKQGSFVVCIYLII